MTRTLRIAALSAWHVHAPDYVRQVNAQADAEIACVWDEHADRGRRWAAELGVPFIERYTDVFARDDVDGVVVTSPTDMHRELIVAAAEAGKHVFTEKVLATTLAEARAIASAVRQSDINFAISFPRRGIAAMRHAKALIDAGKLGDVTLVRIRIAHDGSLRNWLPPHFYDPKACGGGAMIDLGAHGMYLSRWLLGDPVRIASVFTRVTKRAVEDNAVSTIEFASGAIAINETAFVSWGGAFCVEIDGTRGGFQMLNPRDVRVRIGDDKSWQAAESMPVDDIAPIPRWLAAIRGEGGGDFGMGIDEAVTLSMMMEAAYRSQQQRRTIDVQTL
jgi:predicted dehydrogenase